MKEWGQVTKSIGSPGLVYAISSEDKTDFGVPGSAVKHNSICGIAYYQATAEHGLYVEDMHEQQIAPSSRVGHYGEIIVRGGWAGMQSELAMPIEADGFRVGVLNLESDLKGAYGKCHIESARKLAEKAGRLYSAMVERQRRAKRLHPQRTERAYKDLQRVCERLWSIAHEGHKVPFGLALLVYHADYQTGMLKAQDPNVTVLNGAQRQAAPPEFTFREERPIKEMEQHQSLATRVYHSAVPCAYPDSKQAMRDHKLPLGPSLKQLGILGPLIGFPVSIHGHVSGVVVSWFRDTETAEIDGRDIDLFRRASHLMANSFTSESQIEGGKTEWKFASVKLVDETLDCLQSPKSDTSASGKARLNSVGQYFRSQIGSALESFLKLISESEGRFTKKMTLARSEHSRPTLWVSPRRCRCWIRCQNSTNDKALFVLALEVTLGESTDFSNLSSSGIGIAMQPFRSAHKENTGRATVGCFEVDGHHYDEPVKTIDNNPHLSFLLSRVSAYPFAFLQLPRYIDHDVMAEVLHKDRTIPWFVGPIILANATDWVDGIGPRADDIPEDRLAGYLTFDSGWHANTLPGVGDTVGESDRVEVQDDWKRFQDDLIHQVSLFAACLAQRDCFRNLSRINTLTKRSAL